MDSQDTARAMIDEQETYLEGQIEKPVPEPPEDDHLITKLDIVAMKAADRFAIYHEADKRGSGILCIAKADPDDPYGREPEYFIPCASRISQKYLDDDRRGYKYAYDMIWRFSRVASRINTVIDLLKPGDIIELVWQPENDNDYMKRAKIHRDELRLHIHRSVRGKPKEWVFLLSVSCCPNNTARMIRRNKWGG